MPCTPCRVWPAPRCLQLVASIAQEAAASEALLQDQGCEVAALEQAWAAWLKVQLATALAQPLPKVGSEPAPRACGVKGTAGLHCLLVCAGWRGAPVHARGLTAAVRAGAVPV